MANGKCNKTTVNDSDVLNSIVSLQTKKLSREEEITLAIKMRSDPTLRWDFASHYFKWAIKIAAGIYSSVCYDPAYTMEDIAIMAICELLTATKEYRPEKSRFTTYSCRIIVNNVCYQLRLKRGSAASKRRPKTMQTFDTLYQGDDSYDLHQVYGLEDNTLQDVDIVSEFRRFGNETSRYLELWILYDLSISEIARKYDVSRYHVDKKIKDAVFHLRNRFSSAA